MNFKEMSYEELIDYIYQKDCYNELIGEDELIEIIKDRLEYGFYGQAKNYIDILMLQKDNFSNHNYWKNDFGTIIPLLTKEDILENFDYMFR